MQTKRITPGSRWIWVKMPEKNYFGHVSIEADGWSRITMIDPIPNRPDDECYGESRVSKSIENAVHAFEHGMRLDRKKYFGSAKWRPSRETLRKLWSKRSLRLREIHDGGG